MIVYKYRDWNNAFHKKVLTANELYLASPRDFNDPFDCKIIENFSLLSPKEIDDYLLSAAENSFKNHPDKFRLIPMSITSFKQRCKNADDMQREFNQIVEKDHDELFGILSLSKTWQSIPMWSYYSNCHKGFCIGFDEIKIRDARIFQKAADVIYSENFPQIKPKANKNEKESLENAFIKQYVKSEEWKHEQEYRLLRNYFPKPPISSKERIYKIKNDAFAEVIIGINMLNEYKQEIVKICKAKNISVFQAKKSMFSFNMEREQVL
jgi:hypothetical protein